MCSYEDNFVKVCKTEIVIDGYYFPTYQSKTINLSDVKRVYYKKQRGIKDFGKVKGWGMAFTPVWWASDICRGCTGNNYNVVLDTDKRIKKGFSVVRIEEFLNALKLVIPDVPYINELPGCGSSEEQSDKHPETNFSDIGNM